MRASSLTASRRLSRRAFVAAAGGAALGLWWRPGRAAARVPTFAAAAPPVTPVHAIPGGFLHTDGVRIASDSGATVRLAGVNWYGFDTSSMVAGGLDHRPVADICATIARLGFNVIRLPFSTQLVLDNPVITDFLGANDWMQGMTALEIMDVLITTAGRFGLRVILDNHRSEAGWGWQTNGLWYTQQYPESAWIEAWRALVQRHQSDPTVIGCDVRNEPAAPPSDPTAWPANGGAVWGYGDSAPATPRDWASAAERAASAILNINPNLLIFVEGVRYDQAGPSLGGTVYPYWPGGNLIGVGNPASPARPQARPVSLSVPNRLVYSVHDYGPDLYPKLAWCQPGTTANTADACRTVWDQSWGYIVRQGIAPVFLGEFGTVNGYKPTDLTPREQYTDPNTINPQGSWFSYLVDYIQELGLHWAYWCLNGTQPPDIASGLDVADWYGVLAPDWATPSSPPLMAKLRAIQ